MILIINIHMHIIIMHACENMYRCLTVHGVALDVNPVVLSTLGIRLNSSAQFLCLLHLHDWSYSYSDLLTVELGPTLEKTSFLQCIF